MTASSTQLAKPASNEIELVDFRSDISMVRRLKKYLEPLLFNAYLDQLLLRSLTEMDFDISRIIQEAKHNVKNFFARFEKNKTLTSVFAAYRNVFTHFYLLHHHPNTHVAIKEEMLSETQFLLWSGDAALIRQEILDHQEELFTPLDSKGRSRFHYLMWANQLDILAEIATHLKGTDPALKLDYRRKNALQFCVDMKFKPTFTCDVSPELILRWQRLYTIYAKGDEKSHVSIPDDILLRKLVARETAPASKKKDFILHSDVSSLIAYCETHRSELRQQPNAVTRLFCESLLSNSPGMLVYLKNLFPKFFSANFRFLYDPQQSPAFSTVLYKKCFFTPLPHVFIICLILFNLNLILLPESTSQTMRAETILARLLTLIPKLHPQEFEFSNTESLFAIMGKMLSSALQRYRSNSDVEKAFDIMRIVSGLKVFVLSAQFREKIKFSYLNNLFNKSKPKPDPRLAPNYAGISDASPLRDLVVNNKSPSSTLKP